MDTPSDPRWVPGALLAGCVYFVVGLTFAALANASASDHTAEAWRLAAFLVSGAVYAGHIAYEQHRFRQAPRAEALHVSVAVALGAFALAFAANLRALETRSEHQMVLSVALVAWPAVTGVVAFVVALVVCSVLARNRREN